MSLLRTRSLSLALLLHRLACAAQPPPLTGQEAVETANGLACADFGECDSCLSARAPSSCCWCPSDDRCHSKSGIFSSACQGNCTSKPNASTCPAAPAKRTAFRPDVAERMAVFSSAAYYSNPRQQKAFPASFEIVMNVTYSIGPWNSAFAYLGVDMGLKEIVLAFRGSNSLTQLAEELIHSKLRNGLGAPGAMVNDYFLTAIEDLHKNITSALKTVRSRCADCSLMATGHSLGGAMATLASFLLTEESDLKEKVSLYTFGQPRVGNAVTAARLDAVLPIFFRVVNGMDIVAHLPLCTTNSSAPPPTRQWCVDHLENYYHAGTEIWFSKGDYKNGVMCGYKECLGLPAHEDNSCSDGALADAWPSEPDHHGYWSIIPQGYCNLPTSIVDQIVV